MSNQTQTPSYYKCFHVSEECPVSGTTYGYYPNLGANIFFASLFGALFIPSVALGVRSRVWSYTVALSVGLLMEMAGYLGRILMNKNPWDDNAFETQIICIILAPTCIAASIYLTLKHMVIHFGQQHSLLRAKLYPWIFVGCDIGSLVFQAIGGGIAAVAGNTTNFKMLQTGNRFIILGIAFQVFTMTIFGILAGVFVYRYTKAKRDNPRPVSEKEDDPWIFCYAIGIAYITILIRCVYRIPEMAGGWGAPLMRNEKEFLILDSSMIAIATLSLTIFHPALFFRVMGKGRL